MILSRILLCLLVSLASRTVYGLSEVAKAELTSGTSSSSSASSVSSSSSSSSSSAAIAPEARQVPASGVSNSQIYPYNLYQNSLYSGALETPSTGSLNPSTSSLMSYLRSPQGGRRSSLSSRLRNLLSTMFWRESGSPYMTSGSNNFYSYRQPPSFGFSSGLPSSSLQSGYSPSSSSFLNAAASAYRPVVSFPGYGSSGSSGSPSSGSSVWSNYKQWASASSPSLSSALNSQMSSPGGANYAWISSPSNSQSPGSLLASSPLASSSSGYSASPYQVAASSSYSNSVYPSPTYSGSSGPSPYQRSSSTNSNFKPVSSPNSPVSGSSSSSGSSSASLNYKQ